MAFIEFKSQIDMSALNPVEWFDVEATNRTSKSMTYIDDAQTLTVKGSGFHYAQTPGGEWQPVSGVITSIIATGDIVGSIKEMEISVEDVAANIGSRKALTKLFFGGNDSVKGSKFADVLYGFDGNDGIKAGKGADTICGGKGEDVLSGGTGADTFVFSAKESTKKHPDIIIDLEAKDKIDYSSFHVGSVEDTLTVSYNSHGDVTTFSIDVDDDGVADVVIKAIGDHRDFDHFVI